MRKRGSKEEKVHEEGGREGVKWELAKEKRDRRGEGEKEGKKQKENSLRLPSLVMRHRTRQTE